jgi:hypothetical protein
MAKLLREVRVVGSIAYVPLTRGYEAVIDADMVGFIGQFNWYAMNCGGIIYAVRKGPRPRQQTILMHREILKPDEGLEVDHINRDSLDNRLCNLRQATSQQNKHNQTIKRNNKSGFKGVFLESRSKKWVSTIMTNGKSKWLGSYDTPEEAHAAYCKASAELHKEFGRTI